MDPMRWSAVLAFALGVGALQNTTLQSSSTESSRGRSYTGSGYGTNSYNGLNNYDSKMYTDISPTNSNYDRNNNQVSGYNRDYYQTGYANNGGGSQTHVVEVYKSPGYELNSANTDDYENSNQGEVHYDDDDGEIDNNDKATQSGNTNSFYKGNIYGVSNSANNTVNMNNGNGVNNNDVYTSGDTRNGLNSGINYNRDASQPSLTHDAASSMYGKGTQQLPPGYQEHLRNSYISTALGANDYSNNQHYPYYAYSTNYAQSRFHPTRSNRDKDEHKGEVILPPLPPDRPAPAPAPAASSLFAQAVFPGTVTGDLAAQGSDSAPQSALPPRPPTPGSGYNYNPPPPPLPPPATGYSYPPPLPSNQYLPTPMVPPPPPPPLAPTPEEQRQADGFTYYYLGPKLWYIPLLFSIYFVIYVGALIIKAISKHKILFPQHLYTAASQVYSRRLPQDVNLLTERVYRALAGATRRYLRSHIHTTN